MASYWTLGSGWRRESYPRHLARSTSIGRGVLDLRASSEPLYLEGRRLDGTSGYFKVDPSARWSIQVNPDPSDETSVEGFLYLDKSGRWVSRIERQSQSLHLYGIYQPDPPDEVEEVALAEAARLLADTRRPKWGFEPPLPPELTDYYDWACEDEGPDIADAPTGPGGSPASCGGAHRREGSGIAFYETLDSRRDWFDPKAGKSWTGTNRLNYRSSFGSRLFRTEDGVWINEFRPGEDYLTEHLGWLPHHEISIHRVIDWFREWQTEYPEILRMDLDRENQKLGRLRNDRPSRFGGVTEPSRPETRSGAAAGPSLDDAEAANYLGLVVDQQRKTIKRAGFEPVVTIDRSGLNWALFQSLFDSGDVFCEQSRWIKAWETGGRTEVPERATIDSAFKSLRETLAVLGITVETDRNGGRRLVVLENGANRRVDRAATRAKTQPRPRQASFKAG